MSMQNYATAVPRNPLRAATAPTREAKAPRLRAPSTGNPRGPRPGSGVPGGMNIHNGKV